MRDASLNLSTDISESMAGISNTKAGFFLTGCLLACLSVSTGPAQSQAKAKTSATDNNDTKIAEAKLAKETVRKIHVDEAKGLGRVEALKSSEPSKTIKVAEVPLTAPISTDDPMPKPNGKMLSAIMETTINAPLPFVWQRLTDFTGYPTVFPRIASCKVLKQNGNYVYTESNLKPQMFLRETRQKIVNDLTGKPHVFRWAMLQGNFNSSQGCWELAPDSTGNFCKVKYTLESTSDAIPKSIASVSLKFIQKDIVKTFKRVVEKQYQTRTSNAGHIAENK